MRPVEPVLGGCTQWLFHDINRSNRPHGEILVTKEARNVNGAFMENSVRA